MHFSAVFFHLEFRRFLVFDFLWTAATSSSMSLLSSSLLVFGLMISWFGFRLSLFRDLLSLLTVRVMLKDVNLSVKKWVFNWFRNNVTKILLFFCGFYWFSTVLGTFIGSGPFYFGYCFWLINLVFKLKMGFWSWKLVFKIIIGYLWVLAYFGGFFSVFVLLIGIFRVSNWFWACF